MAACEPSPRPGKRKAPAKGDAWATNLRFAEFLNDVVARFDPQYRHIYVNAAITLHTGRPPEAFLGKTNRELGMPAELVDHWDAKLAEVFRTGQATEAQFAFDGPEGVRNFRTRITPEIDHLGQVRSVLTFARDVTAEQILQQLNAAQSQAATGLAHTHAPGYYQAIVESSDDAIIGKELNGVVTSWNQGAQAIFGYSAAEMLGRSLLVLFPADRLNEELFIIERLLQGEKVDHFETVRVHKSGRPVHVSVTISPIRNADGRIIGASKVARDITPMRLQEARLRLALDATRTGLWDWDVRHDRVERTAQNHLNPEAPFADRNGSLADFLASAHTADRVLLATALADYAANRQEQLALEYRLALPPKVEPRWVLLKGQAVERDAQGLPLRVLGTLSDVTASKRAERALVERESRLSRVLKGSNQGYWDLDLQTRDLQVSERWETMLGYRPGELNLADEAWRAYVHPEDLPPTLLRVEQHVAGVLESVEAEIRCRTKSGAWLWVLTQGRVVQWDAEGRPWMMSGTHTDISERKRFELEQLEANTVFSGSYEGVMVVGSDHRIRRVNPAFTRITGYASDEVLGQYPSILSSGLQSKSFYRDLWERVHQQQYWSGELWNRRKNGEVYAEHLSISTVHDRSGQVHHYIGIFSDITQLKSHEEELDRAAHYDPLTSVPNRRLLADRMEQAIARTARSETSLAVCYLDLDGFKGINDQFGHAIGDQLLVRVTENLKQVLRNADTLARLGGDEFVLLLADIGSPQECALILERVLKAVAQPMDLDGKLLTVSASIGVSLYPQDHADADTLLRHADQAMYRAKDAGKNRFHLFDPDSDRKAQIHRRMVDRLAQALTNHEFRLHYQPKADLASGRIEGVEALIRWQHPEQGLLSPGVFLPDLEGSRMECPVGEWVLDSALAQAHAWRAQGQRVPVSVNVSANHLLSPHFVPHLQAALQRYPGVAPQDLELEVLESSAIHDLESAVEVLQQCKALGVALALDDFGTGYSSLTHLRKLPVDVLKIDQSFVRGMLQDREDHGIVEGVVRLASAFGRRAIAEGVETMAHGAALLALGCPLAQGYAIARPMPADALPAWVQDWPARFADHRQALAVVPRPWAPE
ncbi:MAG: hypothetical protein CFE44_02310 [Burkholderiales bacterium PBB4]|nr:MAG: hypothetical protein CFE44_02310 [Burkholderiales bacterium PBB4]